MNNSEFFLGLQCFDSDLKDCQILLRIDNTTAISYINRMGGVQLENLSLLAKKTWGWCEQRNISVFAAYISSRENSEADAESRSLKTNTKFELTEEAFHKVISEYGISEIDLFATRANVKCGRYVSWKIDLASVASDVFTISWNAEFFYAFPPFSFILRALQKVK